MNVSAPTAETIAPADLFAAFETTFGVDSSNPASQYAIDPSASNEILLGILATTFQVTSTNPTARSAASSLRGLLASFLLYFQLSWNNPSFNYTSGVLQAGLPPELYVDAALTRSVQRLTVPKWTWIVYVVISLGVYLWCVGGMVFTLFVKLPPKSTPFEPLDFASAIVLNGGDNSFVKLLLEVSKGKNTTRSILQDKSIFVREVPLSSDPEEIEIGRRLGLATNGLV